MKQDVSYDDVSLELRCAYTERLQTPAFFLTPVTGMPPLLEVRIEVPFVYLG